MTRTRQYRHYAAEFLGTAFLLAVVVGSGIMGERLSGGNTGLALLANTLATGCGLLALIVTLGPISGAHFNPVVTLKSAWCRELTWRDVPPYILAQTLGALAGVAAAHGMFDLPLFSISTHARTGAAQWWSECVATFGLLMVIAGSSRHHTHHTPFVVAAYIMAAYWFTASTSFANPAVTLARAFSNTFAGIAPAHILGFVLAQLIGGVLAVLVSNWLFERDVLDAERD
jgi:glycerol uptake facilitator-like aquaporin